MLLQGRQGRAPPLLESLDCIEHHLEERTRGERGRGGAGGLDSTCLLLPLESLHAVDTENLREESQQNQNLEASVCNDPSRQRKSMLSSQGCTAVQHAQDPKSRGTGLQCLYNHVSYVICHLASTTATAREDNSVPKMTRLRTTVSKTGHVYIRVALNCGHRRRTHQLLFQFKCARMLFSEAPLPPPPPFPCSLSYPLLKERSQRSCFSPLVRIFREVHGLPLPLTTLYVVLGVAMMLLVP